MPAGAFFDEDGVWTQILRLPALSDRRPALFLDRDGVVVEEVGHLHRVEDVALIPGAAEVIARANALGVPVIIATNQSGVGKGLFGWSHFLAVQEEILRRLAEAGASIDAVFACPHHPDARPPYRHPDHPARKPNPGMLVRAAGRLPVDLAGSAIVGDRLRDLEAGRRAGLFAGVLVGALEGERDGIDAIAGPGGFRVAMASTLASAAVHLPFLQD